MYDFVPWGVCFPPEGGYPGRKKLRTFSVGAIKYSLLLRWLFLCPTLNQLVLDLDFFFSLAARAAARSFSMRCCLLLGYFGSLGDSISSALRFALYFSNTSCAVHLSHVNPNALAHCLATFLPMVNSLRQTAHCWQSEHRVKLAEHFNLLPMGTLRWLIYLDVRYVLDKLSWFIFLHDKQLSIVFWWGLKSKSRN